MMAHDKIFETKSTDMDTKGLQVLRSGQTFGWLRKKTQTFGVSRHCPRFFTVDFDARVLYYSHTEFGKKVSMPTPFCDILAVEPLAYRGSANLSDDDDMVQRKPRTKGMYSCMPRITKDKRHGFTIFTKAKHIELRCTSASGSQKWIATIQAAVLLGKEGCYDELGSEQSTRTCSRQSSLGNGSEQGSDEVAEQFEVEHGLDSPVAEVPESNIAEPGRCLAVGSFGTDHPSSPSSPVVKLPSSRVTDGLPTPPLPQPIGAGSEQHGYEPEVLIQPCSEELPAWFRKSSKRSVRFSGGYACMEEGERSNEEDQEVPSSLVLAPPVEEAKGDLQSLLIDAVLSSSSSTANNAWKRPQQPSIEKPPPQPNISPLSSLEEFEGKKLPTIKEESTPRAEDVVDNDDETTRPSLRDRFLARGVTIPHDITIP